MNATVEINLALILFLPWFLILGTLFWLYPRQPRNAQRRLFDAAWLIAATVIFVLGVQWAHGAADPAYGRMWKQVYATSVGYGLFLGVLTVAFLLRRRWIASRAA